MKNGSKILLVAAFVVPFFAVGIPYWPIPYSKVSLPDSLYGIGLIVVFLAAVACRYLAAVRFRSATLSAGASVPGAVMARVIYETAIDPTSHNLWPFELVIAAGVGFSLSLMGSLVGGFLMPRIRSAQADKSPTRPRVSR
ncbi:MAG TPA: hypothetical protein VGH16_09340 [Candidatus Binatia bacterium]|jgi:hypothetical protein